MAAALDESKRVGMEVVKVQNRGWMEESDERGATCYERGSFIPGSRLPSSRTSPSRAAASSVPFTLSVAVAATIDPPFRFFSS